MTTTTRPTHPDTTTEYIALAITTAGDVQPLFNPTSAAITRVIGHTTTLTLSLTAALDVWVDKHAALSARPVNPLATAIATALSGTPTAIHGPALIASHSDSGMFTGLHPDELRDFMAWISDITTLCDRQRTRPAA